MLKRCIGLFGTCGESTFRRDLFIPKYESLGLKDGVDFFNPQVKNWNPNCAVLEAQHLAEDSIILFPITHETYGLGSLSEVGFSLLHAIRLNGDRDFIVMIDQHLSPKLMRSEVLAKESLRARRLVLEHSLKLGLSSLFVVNTLQDMLDLSVELFHCQTKKSNVREKYQIKTETA
jgi:hypothetical protein